MVPVGARRRGVERHPARRTPETFRENTVSACVAARAMRVSAGRSMFDSVSQDWW
jgi:hypothetical protein